VLTMLNHWRCASANVGLHVADGSPNKRSTEAYLPTRGSGMEVDQHVLA